MTPEQIEAERQLAQETTAGLKEAERQLAQETAAKVKEPERQLAQQTIAGLSAGHPA